MTCGPLAVVHPEARRGSQGQPSGMLVTAALCRRDLARLRFPLRFQMKFFSFMWSHFTSCSLPFLFESDLYLFFLRLIYVSTYIYKILDIFIQKKADDSGHQPAVLLQLQYCSLQV